MKRSESEILNDPDIWHVSDSDDDLNFGANQRQKRREDVKSNSGSDQGRGQDPDEIDEVQMARYLVETAPTLDRSSEHSNRIEDLWRKTAGERDMIVKKERSIKALVELCILRCIRPDHLIEAMDRLVLQVLDPHYLNFQEDILRKWQAEKQEAYEREAKKKASYFGQPQKKSLAHSKTSGLSKNMPSNTGSQGGSQLNRQGTLNDSGMNNTQVTTTSAARRAAREDQDRGDKEGRERRSGLNNISVLLDEAYIDSSPRTPVFFIVSDSINVLDIVSDYYLRKFGTQGGQKVLHFSLGQGLEEFVDGKLT